MKFKLIEDGSRRFIEFENGARIDATAQEIILWDLLSIGKRCATKLLSNPQNLYDTEINEFLEQLKQHTF